MEGPQISLQEQARAIRAWASVHQNILSGMTLDLEPPAPKIPTPPRPLLKRCACGRVISLNKSQCLACKHAA